ncbi:MAG: nucleoside-diphosphate kinase, partial [Fibrobacteres bacterium]|nr:nucleoside-diphosphate kinase [Fibrobacterota bacterium]
MTEQTLVMIKPNGVRKMLVGEVLSRFEKSRLKIVKLQMKKLSKETAEKFYAEHK